MLSRWAEDDYNNFLFLRLIWFTTDCNSINCFCVCQRIDNQDSAKSFISDLTALSDDWDPIKPPSRCKHPHHESVLGILQPANKDTRQRNQRWAYNKPSSVQPAAAASVQTPEAWFNKLPIWHIYQRRHSVCVCVCVCAVCMCVFFFLKAISRRDYSLLPASVLLKPY